MILPAISGKNIHFFLYIQVKSWKSFPAYKITYICDIAMVYTDLSWKVKLNTL